MFSLIFSETSDLFFSFISLVSFSIINCHVYTGRFFFKLYTIERIMQQNLNLTYKIMVLKIFTETFFLVCFFVLVPTASFKVVLRSSAQFVTLLHFIVYKLGPIWFCTLCLATVDLYFLHEISVVIFKHITRTIMFYPLKLYNG